VLPDTALACCEKSDGPQLDLRAKWSIRGFTLAKVGMDKDDM